jgi:hypothetical protein
MKYILCTFFKVDLYSSLGASSADFSRYEHCLVTRIPILLRVAAKRWEIVSRRGAEYYSTVCFGLGLGLGPAQLL